LTTAARACYGLRPVKVEKGFYEALGRRIEQHRSARHMSQERLGAALSPPLTRAAISNIETAKQRVLAHVLADLARALSVGVSELIETPRPEAQAAETSKLKKSLEEALPREAVDIFTRNIDRRQRLAAKGKTT
jgi:transcriptional regulator with XRE-family HTH domain